MCRAVVPGSVLPRRDCGWIASPHWKSTTIWPAVCGTARPGPSATRTAWAGSMLSKAARQTSSDCRWSCWQRCWRRDENDERPDGEMARFQPASGFLTDNSEDAEQFRELAG